ncbi:MAG: sulfotransferase [Deltaproteobacteria bacterium]|nr:MAG: sulfotransferase [Deltaproteobacteria bacterium]
MDRACGIARNAGFGVTEISAEAIIDAARKRTGLEDWGSDAFLEPMARAIEEIGRARFTDLGRVIIRQALVTALSNRLKVEEYFRRHPDAAEVAIERPVFILGFPRTGTTLLQNLLTLEEGTRSLKFWELQSPVPVSANRAEDRRIRIARTERTLRAAYLMAPEMREVHEIRAETSEECWPLFANAFSVLNWDIGSGLRGYGDWLLRQSMVEAYRYYKRQLQMIAHFRPTGRFILKCPEHLWFVDALLEVFPDACLVWTHRDPFDVIASYCSLISLNRRVLYGRIDPVEIGAHITDRFATGVRRAMAVRRAQQHDQIYDVDFRALVKDQAGMVHHIRRAFDLPDGPGADARIQAWLENGRRDKRGAHVYDPQRYGLVPEQVYPAFSDYIDRFGVPLANR